MRTSDTAKQLTEKACDPYGACRFGIKLDGEWLFQAIIAGETEVLDKITLHGSAIFDRTEEIALKFNRIIEETK